MFTDSGKASFVDQMLCQFSIPDMHNAQRFSISLAIVAK